MNDVFRYHIGRRLCTHIAFTPKHRAGTWHWPPFLIGGSAKGCRTKLNRHKFADIFGFAVSTGGRKPAVPEKVESFRIRSAAVFNFPVLATWKKRTGHSLARPGAWGKTAWANASASRQGYVLVWFYSNSIKILNLINSWDEWFSTGLSNSVLLQSFSDKRPTSSSVISLMTNAFLCFAASYIIIKSVHYQAVCFEVFQILKNCTSRVKFKTCINFALADWARRTLSIVAMRCNRTA